LTPALQQRVVTPDGTALHAIVRRGEPGRLGFLLVHGLASNAMLWDSAAEVLAAHGHGSVAVDQRGHGRSDKVAIGFDFATLVEDLAAVITATGGGPVIAAGQSWGGNVVLELAAVHPELVAGVVCVDGGFINLSDTFETWEVVADRLAPPPITGMQRADLEAGMQTWLADFPPTGIAAQLANYEELADGTVRPHLARDSHMTILRFLWDHDPDELSQRVVQPVLVIAASGGVASDQSKVAAFTDRLQSGSVVWMDAHHDVHAQRPDDVGDLLVDFAAGIAGDGVR
jgi:pimeloyl-ACP methyl ester carboxylesterase